MAALTPASTAPERARAVIRRLEKKYPGARIVLAFSNPMELLVAVMLSAQCTDKKVNEVTASLFKKYHSMEDYAHADVSELERDIRSTGFYRVKARNVIASANMLVNEFGGQVPQTMEELTRLPGVARKTANVVLGNAFGVVEGIAVDTHVFRVTRRLGLADPTMKDPNKVEAELMEVVPRGDWVRFTYLVIDHGRAVCGAKKALCERCVLADICPSAFKM